MGASTSISYLSVIVVEAEATKYNCQCQRMLSHSVKGEIDKSNQFLEEKYFAHLLVYFYSVYANLDLRVQLWAKVTCCMMTLADTLT